MVTELALISYCRSFHRRREEIVGVAMDAKEDLPAKEEAAVRAAYLEAVVRESYCGDVVGD